MRNLSIFILMLTMCFIHTPLSVASEKNNAAINDDLANIEKSPKTIYKGFSGGMMLHLGYQGGPGKGFPDTEQNCEQETHLRSITYGLGGMLRVHLFNHLHIGGEGYVSTIPLRSQGIGSNIRNGWGGLLADYYVEYKKIQFFIGGTIGGGSQRCLHVMSEKEYTLLGDNFRETWDNLFSYTTISEESAASYVRTNYMLIDPYIGLEYALTSKVHLTCRLDYVLGLHRQTFVTPSGPRLYAGFLFGI